MSNKIISKSKFKHIKQYIFSNNFPYLPMIVIGSLVLCCGCLFGITAIQSTVFERCLESYAKKIDTQPSTVAVTTKLFEMITPNLSPSMTVDEVHEEFNKVVRSEFYRQGVTLDGGAQELVMLSICPWVSLDTILIDYSMDGYFIEARMYFGD
jgi:hypothetical protein